MRMALIERATAQLSKYKKDKLRHEHTALYHMKTNKEFGPSAHKIEKLTKDINQVITNASEMSRKSRHKHMSSMVAAGISVGMSDSASVRTDTKSIMAISERLNQPKYTTMLYQVLFNQRKRHEMQLKEIEKKELTTKIINHNTVDRIRKFLHTDGDLGPIAENVHVQQRFYLIFFNGNVILILTDVVHIL
jgi:hypothetical protein